MTTPTDDELDDAIETMLFVRNELYKACLTASRYLLLSESEEYAWAINAAPPSMQPAPVPQFVHRLLRQLLVLGLETACSEPDCKHPGWVHAGGRCGQCPEPARLHGYITT